MLRFRIKLLMLVFIITTIGCQKSKESQIKSFVKNYNNSKAEIMKGNGFVDTKSTFKEPDLINIDVVIKSGNKLGIKNFLSKYEPKDLTKAIDFITDPTFLLEQGVNFNFNFYKVNGDLLLSKTIDADAYKKFKSELVSKTSGNVNQSFYLNILNKELQKLNNQLPLSSSNNTINFQKLTRDEKDYLVYKCSCRNTSKMKQNNRIYKVNFEKEIVSFPLLKEIYLLMNEVNIKAIKFECFDEDTKKPFDFVFYKKDILDLY